MKNKRFTLIELLVVIMVLCAITLGIGWCMNIYKLCKCDFEAPYQSEAIRGIGVFVPPVGGIAGFLELKDGPVEERKEL